MASDSIGQAALRRLSVPEVIRRGGGAARREARLVAAASQGSEDAFNELFRTHWPRAYRTAYLIARDQAAAEDIAQEAFFSALRALDGFDRSRPFGPWLSRIVANRAIDWTRSRAVKSELRSARMDEQEAEVGYPTSEGAAGPVNDELHRAILGLDLEQRTCVVLRYLLEWTPGEIAELLGVPRGTVNSRLRRALDRLAVTLGEHPA